jgi:hypothetical protein
MTRVLHIPTGIVFFVPDMYYFRRLFDQDICPDSFSPNHCTQAVMYMIRIIDLMEEAGDFFKTDGYPDSVREIREMGLVSFEVLNVR